MLALVAAQMGLTSVVRATADPAVPAACEESSDSRPVDATAPASPGGTDASAGGLRVVTYNIHSGLGSGFSLWQSRATVERNLREIAGDILAAAPLAEPVEVVALNEVDFGSRRSAWIDEAAFLAGELSGRSGQRYEIVRGQTWERSAFGREVHFGNALLVRLPIVSSSSCLFGAASCDAAPPRDDLPTPRASGMAGLMAEERGVIKVRVRAGARELDFVATHLDAFSAQAREEQAMHLLHRFVDPARSTVLLGDLNAVATSLTGERRFFRNERTLDILTSATLADVRTSYASLHAVNATGAWATYPADAPVWPLDAVLASVDLFPVEIAVIGRGASDHRGLMARLAATEDPTALALRRARHDRTRGAQRERILRCDLASELARLRRGWLIEKTGFASLQRPAS